MDFARYPSFLLPVSVTALFQQSATADTGRGNSQPYKAISNYLFSFTRQRLKILSDNFYRVKRRKIFFYLVHL
jgi:hypothetical protein